MLVAYEVHIYESGDWQIASMFNERELALMEARRIEEGLRRRNPLRLRRSRRKRPRKRPWPSARRPAAVVHPPRRAIPASP
jgi:hypothetical protein